MREHCNSNLKVRLHANAVDPEVRSETGETIAVSGYRGHTYLRQSENCEPVRQIKLSIPGSIISI